MQDSICVALPRALATPDTIKAFYRAVTDNEALSESQEKQLRAIALTIEDTLLAQHPEHALRLLREQTIETQYGSFTVGSVQGSGDSSSTLPREDGKELGDYEYNAALDGIESFLLSLACTGMRIDTPHFKEAFETALDSMGNLFADDDQTVLDEEHV